jgi:erythromycin esterase-like protein
MRAWALLSVALIAACGGNGAPPRADPQPNPWNKSPPTPGQPPRLPAGLHPLPALDGAADDSALATVAAATANARIVGLGGAPGDALEIVTAAARITRFLVEARGYRLIALRASRADATRACASEKMAWACAPRDGVPVRFVGIDPCDPMADLVELRRWVRGLSSSPAEAARLLAPLMACSTDATTPYDALAHEACLRALEDVDVWVHARSFASPEALFELRLATTGLRAWQNEHLYATDDPARASDAREAASAALLEAHLARAPGLRAIVWTDARSLYRRRDRVDGAAAGTTSLGTALADNFGDAYVPIALAAHEVTPGTLEAKLHALGEPRLFVDLADPALDAFLAPHGKVSFGAPADTLVPREQLAAIVFFDRAAAPEGPAP